MSENRVLLAEMTAEEIEQATGPNTVVVLPLGATEQHGPHLAVKTDSYLLAEIAMRAARHAAQHVPVLVAPVLPYGCSSYHAGFAGTPSIAYRTYIQLIKELGESLLSPGFQRLFLLNGHGGNTGALALAAEELHETTGAVVATACYWSLAAGEIGMIRESAPGGICHACELETSCMMALDPSAVRPERMVKAVPMWKGGHPLCDLVAEGPVVPAFRVAEVSPSGVLGDPTLATAEKGQRFLDAIVDRVAACIVELAGWGLEQRGR